MVKRKRMEGEAPPATAGAGAAVASVNGHSWKEKASPTNGFVKGKFAKNESDKLRKAIENYAAANNITVQKLATRSVRKQRGSGVSSGAGASAAGASASSSSTGGRGLNNAWIAIANNADLPHRTLMAIYNHGCRIANKFNYKGAWSEAEVTKLRELVSTHGKKWTKISEEMEREVRGIQQKWKKLTDSDRVKRARTSGSSGGKVSAIASASSSVVGSAAAGAAGAAAAVSVAPSKANGQSREEIVKLLTEQVRANCGSNVLWPVSDIKWGVVSKSFPGRTVGSLRERWNTILAKHLTFSSVEDNALVDAVAACGATDSAEVPWTRLRSQKEYQAAFTKASPPPQRPGQHYRRRFMKLERNAFAHVRGTWEQAQKQAQKTSSSEVWVKHLESKRAASWANRVKDVKAFLDARVDNGASSSSSSSSSGGGAVSAAVAPAGAAPALVAVTAHSVTAV
jgi:hypothetical protein